MRAAFRNSLFPDSAIAVLGLALFTACALPPSSARGANDDKRNEIEARYQRERAACDKSQDRAACLREAVAAHDAAKRGQLDDVQPDYEQNALARCAALPEVEREVCRRRVRGEGEARGSVAGGGIYREYREITIPGTPPRTTPGQQNQSK